jgi:phosphoribosylcarboxyaminoimidazole (NCAIR) mutase
LALSDADMAKKLSEFRAKQTAKVLSKTLPEV